MHLFKKTQNCLTQPWVSQPTGFLFKRKSRTSFLKSTSAFFLTLWHLHMMPPWLQGSCILSWLQHKLLRRANVSKMWQWSPALSSLCTVSGLPSWCSALWAQVPMTVSGSYHGVENLPSAQRSSLNHLPSSQFFVPR